ncbi:GDP-mannose dehydrogenase [bacterium K02(2017)]|nr:GDP-mannose dehydrogenase [bacterium K02(2017)]
MNTTQERIVSVVGLGYVGLPVAVAFGKVCETIGFDINPKRIIELVEGFDRTGEVETAQLKESKLFFTNKESHLSKANFHIIAVPTPITEANQPDLTPIIKASETVGRILKKGDIVVYESTVYPGVTEEECLPVLEKLSGLVGGVDFKVGYSPERINPGDKKHTLKNIVKVVSAQDDESLEVVSAMYGRIVKAGVHRAATIKVAEAAKIIENTQRDLNISLMNELAIIFDKMEIDTNDVLAAAGTKWNFLPFKPGLVGGHCIGVDPYYLTHKAEKLGYHPQVILAGRRINDNMGRYIANQTVKAMVHAGHQVFGSTVTVMGLTFKEDCPDIRNSKVVDIINELKEFGIKVQVHDPCADVEEAKNVYDVDLVSFDKLKTSASIIVAVSHQEYKDLPMRDLKSMSKENSVFMDIKGIFPKSELKRQGFQVWRL